MSASVPLSEGGDAVASLGVLSPEYLSMADLSALCSDWMPRVSVTLRGYYDKSGDLAEGRVTLAGYAAPISAWERFERRWMAVLASAPAPCSYLHLTEAKHLLGPFHKSLGWTHRKVAHLLKEVFNQCLSPEDGVDEADHLSGVYCTVIKEDFERACRELPHLESKGWAAICAEFVTYIALTRLPQDPSKPKGSRLGVIEVHFDRNEPFRREIEDAWNAAKDRPEGQRGPLSLVLSIGYSDMRQTPGLQAADYLAWHVNRWRTTGSPGAGLIATAAAQGVGVMFDYETLMEWYREGPDPLFPDPTPPQDP